MAVKPELIYEHRYSLHPRSERAVMLLHGISSGIDSEFMRALWQRIAPVETCLMVEFPFIKAGTEPSEGLNKEINVLQSGLKYLEKAGVEHTHIVAKSLGGVVASRWLQRVNRQQFSTDLIIMGYALGDVSTANLEGHLRLVVQGSEDRFGTAADVKAELARHNIEADVVNIRGGDHSFRSADGTDDLSRLAIEAAATKLLLSEPPEA